MNEEQQEVESEMDDEEKDETYKPEAGEEDAEEEGSSEREELVRRPKRKRKSAVTGVVQEATEGMHSVASETIRTLAESPEYQPRVVLDGDIVRRRQAEGSTVENGGMERGVRKRTNATDEPSGLVAYVMKRRKLVGDAQANRDEAESPTADAENEESEEERSEIRSPPRRMPWEGPPPLRRTKANKKKIAQILRLVNAKTARKRARERERKHETTRANSK